MRRLATLLAGCLAVLLGQLAAGAQDSAARPSEASGAPSTVELVEDLRILSILNTLAPSRDQASKLAGVADAGKEGLAAIEAEAKATLERQRDRLLAARAKLVRGGEAPPATDSQLAAAGQVAASARAQKTEVLITTLASRVRRILSLEQAARIEDELAPTGDQAWRRYGRVLTGPGTAARASSRLPADPGKWLHELRDLRIDSAEGDPAFEVEDFARKLTRGLPGGTPLFEQSFTQARTFATQVLAMPPAVFSQREWELARMAAKQELDTRNRQRIDEGKAIETFDPYRWLVVEVLLSPRAAADLRDRAAAR